MVKHILAGMAISSRISLPLADLAWSSLLNNIAFVTSQEDLKSYFLCLNTIELAIRSSAGSEDHVTIKVSISFKWPLISANVITNIRDVKSNLYSASKTYPAIHSAESPKLSLFILGQT